jgi:hypothetical protein
MPVDAAKATVAQLVFLIVCYVVVGTWCAVLAIRGTRNWNTFWPRIFGGIAAMATVGYAGYLTVALIRHAGFLPLGLYGLLLPGWVILNAYRREILRIFGRRNAGGRRPARRRWLR